MDSIEHKQLTKKEIKIHLMPKVVKVLSSIKFKNRIQKITELNENEMTNQLVGKEIENLN